MGGGRQHTRRLAPRYWMMHDVAVNHSAPYTTNGLETLLGFFDSETGKPKPGVAFFAQFATELAANASAGIPPPALPEDDAAAIGLYVR